MYKVNLLPPHLQREGLVDTRRLLKVGGVVLLSGIVVLGYGSFLLNYLLVKSKLVGTQQELQRLGATAAQAEVIYRERLRLEGALKEYDALSQARRNWNSILKDLGRLCPSDLWLVELEAAPPAKENEAAELQGLPAYPDKMAIKGISRSFASIGVFERKLWESGYFQEVRLVKVGAAEGGACAFEMEIRLR